MTKRSKKVVRAWAVIEKASNKIWGWKGHFEIHRTRRAANYYCQDDPQSKESKVVPIEIRIFPHAS